MQNDVSITQVAHMTSRSLRVAGRQRTTFPIKQRLGTKMHEGKLFFRGAGQLQQRLPRASTMHFALYACMYT